MINSFNYEIRIAVNMVECLCLNLTITDLYIEL